ncbi:MAG: peptidylprolyl isomerase [Planctomycetota bacterium]
MRALTFSIVVIFIAVVWPGSAFSQSSDEPETGIFAVRLYNGINRPAIVNVRFDPVHDEASVALLDADGRMLRRLPGIRPGRFDLAERDSDFWQRKTCVYAQLMLLDTPVGAPLVIQPMLTRQVPITSREIHPSYGDWYTRIIGWRDENAPEPKREPEVFTAPGEERPTDSIEPKEDDDSENSAPVEVISTGVRMFPERDVLMRTTEGDIRFAMAHHAAPNTAWNFIHLCEGGFYDNVIYHRVVPFDREGRPFVIQAGDPSETGDGGPGYWLPIESSTLPHDFGVISMARADDPDSAGSQFFVCLSREGTARLDVQYCAFGFAIDGRETILKIAQTPLADPATGAPVDAPVILETRVEPAPPRVPDVPRAAWRVPEVLVVEPPKKSETPERVPR